MAHYLFLGGVRLSTWVTVLVFLAVTAYRADWRPFLACLAWLWGFEAAYQLTSVMTGHHLPAWKVAPFALATIGVLVVVYSAARGIKPSGEVMGIVAAVWVVWVATGFHVNGHTLAGFDPRAEVLNELAKTLWAIAYLVPLFAPRGDRSRLRSRRYRPVGPSLNPVRDDARLSRAP